MNAKRATAFLILVGVAASGLAQGQLVFRNGSNSRVIDAATGMPALSGEFTAGLYYTILGDGVPDVPMPGLGNDGWSLAATAPIVYAPVAGGGLYSGGVITLSSPETSPGEPVWVQVRAWTDPYGTYEEAFYSGRGPVGVSEPLLVTLGGGVLPPPSLAALGISEVVIWWIPEPSTVALGLLGAGLGGMMLVRRRRS